QAQDDVIVPLVFEQDARRAQRSNNFLRAIGKLKPGVTEAQAHGDLGEIMRQMQVEHPDTNALRSDVVLEDLRTSLVGRVRNSMLLLLGAVGTVLLIACANLAALQLARATERGKEIAIRVSMGATRSRLMRQLLTESVLISLVGGALGLLVASIGTQAMVGLSPASLPRAAEIGISWEVAGFTLAISVLCGVIFGLVPSLEQMRVNLTESMKEGERGG